MLLVSRLVFKKHAVMWTNLRGFSIYGAMIVRFLVFARRSLPDGRLLELAGRLASSGTESLTTEQWATCEINNTEAAPIIKLPIRGEHGFKISCGAMVGVWRLHILRLDHCEASVYHCVIHWIHPGLRGTVP